MKRFFVCLYVGLLLAHPVRAQTADSAEAIRPSPQRPFTFYASSGFGAYLPITNTTGLSLTALSNVFIFETEWDRRYFARFALDMTNVNYIESGTINGIGVSKKDRLGINHLGLDAGCRRTRTKTNGFGYVGAGFAQVDVPLLRIDVPNQRVEFETVSATFLNLRLGVGVEYIISRAFIPYVEAQVCRIPYATQFNNQPISGLTCLVGIRGALE